MSDSAQCACVVASVVACRTCAGVKFDAGGGNDNMTLWAEAINATGRVMMLENCNNGGDVPYGLNHGLDAGCPFNIFRTGIDNAPSPLSMVSNLLDASRFFNVSRPGCWACESFALICTNALCWMRCV